MTLQGLKPTLGLAIAVGLFIGLSQPNVLLAKDGNDKKDKEKDKKTEAGSNNNASTGNDKDKGKDNPSSPAKVESDSKDTGTSPGPGSDSTMDAGAFNHDRGPQNIHYHWGRIPLWGHGQSQHGKIKAQIINHIFRSVRHHKNKGQDDHKITLCHKGQEISVSVNALHAHLAHGDTIGSCDVTPVKNH